MAEKKMTVAEILAKRKEFEEMLSAQLEAERPSALLAVKEQISLYKFTAEELEIQAAPAPAMSSPARSSGTRVMNKPLKSTKSEEVGVWLAHPPKFLEAEGCFTTYKSGKSVDEWLVNPTEKKAKINFLKKLSSREGKKPTKEQLGDITDAEFQKA